MLMVLHVISSVLPQSVRGDIRDLPGNPCHLNFSEMVDFYEYLRINGTIIMLGLFDLLVIGGPNQVLLFFSAFILTWLIVS